MVLGPDAEHHGAAGLVSEGPRLKLALAAALSHVFFNLFGVLVWYVAWPLRVVPLGLARALGAATASYRWFPIVFMCLGFVILPLFFLALAAASETVANVLLALVVLTFVIVGGLTSLQQSSPGCLPAQLRSWACLPEWLRSCAPC